MEPHRRLEVVRVERLIRAVRWLCAPFTVVPAILYHPPPGTDLPFDPVDVSVLVAAALVCVNGLSIVASRKVATDALIWTGRAELVADTLLVLIVTIAFRFDVTTASWSLLILPIIEAAMRDAFRGAVITWSVCAASYLGLEAIAPQIFGVTPTRIGSIIFRLELLLLVALATGFLARSLRERAIEHLAARRESEHRAELLHVVARVSRSMNTPKADDVVSAVVDASVQIGFEGAAIVLLDEKTGTYSLAASHGFGQGLTKVVRRSSDGIIGRVREGRTTVVVENYTDWSGGVTDARALGLQAVAATPIWRMGSLFAVLAVATRQRASVSPHEVEALELLAAHAGAALATARHFSERRALKAQLHHEALHDALTGLPNRLLFHERLTHCLERQATTRTNTAVVFVDLDGFARVNHAYGEGAGDHVLRVAARRLETLRPPGDTVARYASDQFVLLLEQPRSEYVVAELAGKILRELEAPISVGGHEVSMSASVGCSFAYKTELSRDLQREAELAMRRVKARGGGYFETYRPTMSMRVQAVSKVEQDLRRALKRDEFAVYYQPGISVETGEIVGLEALARWKHPTRGVLVAEDFIPYAQETGLLPAIGQRLLDEIGAQISVWRATGAVPHVPVGVNLSATELLQDDFVYRVTSVLDAHRLHPNDIIFEITESMVMGDDWVTREQLRALRRIGIRLAVDDFGRGYSSLDYLRRFRFAVLKIDRSFVANVIESETDQAIVRYIVRLSHDLGMPAIAEGVETKEQFDYLASIGCPYVQGYHVCEPVTALRLRQLVAEGLIGGQHKEPIDVPPVIAPPAPARA